MVLVEFDVGSRNRITFNGTELRERFDCDRVEFSDPKLNSRLRAVDDRRFALPKRDFGNLEGKTVRLEIECIYFSTTVIRGSYAGVSYTFRNRDHLQSGFDKYPKFRQIRQFNETTATIRVRDLDGELWGFTTPNKFYPVGLNE